jgi:hypothetical protein
MIDISDLLQFTPRLSPAWDAGFRISLSDKVMLVTDLRFADRDPAS